MPGEEIPLTAGAGRALHHVHPRAVLPLHIEVRCQEMRGRAPMEVARDGQRLQKHLRQHHRASQIQHGAALVHRGERSGQAAEVPVAGRTERSSVGGRMLVDDLRTDGRVHGHRHVVPQRRQKNRAAASG
jgi:hypothetical protein